MREAERQRAWRAAGVAAAQLVERRMCVGLGTGRSAAAAIRALGIRVSQGLVCTGVPTSKASERMAREHRIPIAKLGARVDLAFDGADAVDPQGLVVKGAGGAMVRERLVAEAATRFVVLIDPPKLVRSLDTWGTLPVAVLPFAAHRLMGRLAEFAPTRRPGVSDDGLVLIDLDPPPDCDWEAFATEVASHRGVVDHGLFRVDLEDVFVGDVEGGVTPASGVRFPR